MPTRSRVHPYIFKPTRSPFFVWILIGLYSLNDRVFKRSKWESVLWDWIKCELFYIGGACQHSGNCCQQLMLIRNGQLLHTLDLFKAHLKESEHYERFSPTLAEDGQTIQYFSCSCLTPDRLCSDYENRPQICHHYPVSVFVQEDHLLEGCGYKVFKKSPFPSLHNSRLHDRVQMVLNLNKLS